MSLDSFRIGQGIDVHRLVAGRELIIGGVTIPYERGLEGHSDADVLLHAITDAILGAVGEGDIGTRFSNTDPRWKGAASTELLRIVWNDLSDKGWRIVNLDSTVIAEAPKLSPYIAEMKQVISSILNIEPTCCGIKATTSEGLGYQGRGEGISAHAVALLEQVR